MSHQIEEVLDLETTWSDYWPLHDALQEYHAGLGDGRRRLNAEAGSRRRLAKLFAAKPSKVLLAWDGETPVGMASARLVRGGWTGQEAVGHLSDFYIRPQARGTPLVFEFLRRLEDWIRQDGRRFSEHGSIKASERTIRLSVHRGYKPYLESFRREASLSQPGSKAGSDAADDDSYLVCKVTDLEADWTKIWPLLQEHDRKRLAIEPCELAADRQEFRHQEMRSALAAKSLLLVVEKDRQLIAFARGRVVENPSITQERVGLISDLVVQNHIGGGESAASAASWRLFYHLEDWLLKKGAGILETQVLARDDQAGQSLKEAGYSSHKYELRKDLGG